VASPTEDKIITTDPGELIEMKKGKKGIKIAIKRKWQRN